MELKEYKKALFYKQHVIHRGIEYIPGPWTTDISPDMTHWVYTVRLYDISAKSSYNKARLQDVSLKEEI